MALDPNQDTLILGIVGAGAMGRGIAQVAATGGCRVKLFDTRAESVDEALTFIASMLTRAVEKDRMTEADKDAALALIEGAGTMDAFTDCHVVIEAAIENLEIKHTIFKQLENIVAKDTVLATNT